MNDYVEPQLWHSRMGHPPAITLNKLAIMPSIQDSLFSTCDVCIRAKQKRLHFPTVDNHSYQLFDLIHCDLWGPYKPYTHGKCNHFLTIVEQYSKCTWVFLLSDKSHVSTLLRNFIHYVNSQNYQDSKIRQWY